MQPAGLAAVVMTERCTTAGHPTAARSTHQCTHCVCHVCHSCTARRAAANRAPHPVNVFVLLTPLLLTTLCCLLPATMPCLHLHPHPLLLLQAAAPDAAAPAAAAIATLTAAPAAATITTLSAAAAASAATIDVMDLTDDDLAGVLAEPPIVRVKRVTWAPVAAAAGQDKANTNAVSVCFIVLAVISQA